MTVDELLDRITSAELAEWAFVLKTEGEIANAVRQGVDPDVAASMAWGD